MDSDKPNSQTLVQVRNVTKQYRRGKRDIPVLRDISCEISQGDFVFIVGPSGSGKSTLLYLMGGLDQPTTGEIMILGESLSDMNAKRLDSLRRRDVGFIFQSFNLLKTMNCVDNVLAPFIPSGEASAKKSAAETLLKQVGLGDRMHHKPSELSGGEQQRVAIARALLKEPKLILADEPTGELDSETGRQVFDILRKMNRERGTTVVTVTHDKRYMDRDQDIVLEMQDGQFFERDATV